MTPAPDATPVMRVRGLRRHYPVSDGMFRQKQMLRAVEGINFDLHAGETLAVVGESGSGKSTLGRLCALIEEPTAGKIELDGVDVTRMPQEERRTLHRHVQMIFQNPFGSLNPRKTVAAELEAPLRFNTRSTPDEWRVRVEEMLVKVGLRIEFAERYPHMLSGGQRQRVAIARALMLQPKIIVADEPLSALDVSVQAQIINLLMDLRDEFGVSLVFISHDISVVRRLAHQVIVMYLGQPVEQGPVDAVLANPAHPYTKALIDAVPKVRRHPASERIRLVGDMPSPLVPRVGCIFSSRCPSVQISCRSVAPALEHVGDRLVACPHTMQIDPSCST